MISDSKDATLKAAVLRELRLDPRVNETEIGILVTHGVVTLTGRVDTEAERIAAGQAANRAPGVLDIANEIVVRIAFGRGHDDTNLAAAVRDALERHAGESAGCIHTNVCDAVVTLGGTVETPDQAEEAVRIARSVVGVHSVDDQILIRSPIVDVMAIRRSVEKALERRAHREADRIEVTADHGVVTLEGPINSESEEHVVLELVRHAPGVRHIRNHLHVAS